MSIRSPRAAVTLDMTRVGFGARTRKEAMKGIYIQRYIHIEERSETLRRIQQANFVDCNSTRTLRRTYRPRIWSLWQGFAQSSDDVPSSTQEKHVVEGLNLRNHLRATMGQRRCTPLISPQLTQNGLVGDQEWSR